MSSKKKPGRFCIYLNEDDKRHVEAARILNSKGWKKAQFITDAVLFYNHIETGEYKEKTIKAYFKEKEGKDISDTYINMENLTSDNTDDIINSLNAFKNKN